MKNSILRSRYEVSVVKPLIRNVRKQMSNVLGKRKQSINAVVFVCCFAVTFDDIEMTQIYDVQKPLLVIVFVL